MNTGKQKRIEEKLGKRLEHMGTGEIFLKRTDFAFDIRSTIGKWDFKKINLGKERTLLKGTMATNTVEKDLNQSFIG